MLRVILGKPQNADNFVYGTKQFFDNSYEDEWFEDKFTQEMLADVDKSKVIADGIIDGPVGKLPYTKISGGLKTLLLVHNRTDLLCNASTCGDNCAKWLLEIANRHEEDITIVLLHCMDFGDNFKILIENNNTIVDNIADLAYYVSIYCTE